MCCCASGHAVIVCGVMGEITYTIKGTVMTLLNVVG